MKEFHSLEALALHLGEMAIQQHEMGKHALERAAILLQGEAKKKIGTYQGAAGEFVAWAQLADSTMADRAHQGYPEDEPLLRDGTMRDSIERKSDAQEAHVGSDLDVFVYQELGTEKIPPRSVLGATAVEKGEKVAEIVGEAATAALVGQGVFGGRLKLLGD